MGVGSQRNALAVLVTGIFNSFHIRVEFGTILVGLRNFGGWGGFEHPKPPLGTPLCIAPISVGKAGRSVTPTTRFHLASRLGM